MIREEKGFSSEDEWCESLDEFGELSNNTLVRYQNKFIREKTIRGIEDNPVTSTVKCQLCLFCDSYDTRKKWKSVKTFARSDDGYDKMNSKAKMCPGCSFYDLDERSEKPRASLDNIFKEMMIRRSKEYYSDIRLCFGCAIFADKDQQDDSLSSAFPEKSETVLTAFLSDVETELLNNERFGLKYQEEGFSSEDEWCESLDEFGELSNNTLVRYQNKFIREKTIRGIEDHPETSTLKCQLCLFRDSYDTKKKWKSVKTSARSDDGYDKMNSKAKMCPGCSFYDLDERSEKPRASLDNIFKQMMKRRSKEYYSDIRLCFGCAIFADKDQQDDSLSSAFLEKSETVLTAFLSDVGTELLNNESFGLKNPEEGFSSEDEWCESLDEFGELSNNTLVRYQNKFIREKTIRGIEDNPVTPTVKCQLCLFCDSYDTNKKWKSVKTKKKTKKKQKKRNEKMKD